MWDDEDDRGWVCNGAIIAVALMIAVAAVVALVQISLLPFRLVASAVLFYGTFAFAHWLLVKRLPSEPLGFWKALGLDAALGLWLFVTFVALCRHGAWAWLGAWGERWHLRDDARPDMVLAVLGVTFIGWLGLRAMEDAPNAEAFGVWPPPEWLLVGLKISLLFGFAGFLSAGGEAWLKSLFR